MEDIIQIAQIESVEIVEARERVSYDIQVATAKRFPRDIIKSTSNCIAIATMDKETAETCGYALPRGGKPIQGPSVHLAKIIAQNWGNLRVESKVIDITATQIVSSAVCFDLENNIAIKVEVRRSIMDKNKKRFNDDMITVTGNAANSIALRNAIFAVVPAQVTKAAYGAAMKMLVGDISTEEKLIQSRDKIFKSFKNLLGVTESELLTAIGLDSIDKIDKDQIVLLRSMLQSINDGDSTVDDMFKRTNKNPLDKKQAIKDKSENTNKTQLP